MKHEIIRLLKMYSEVTDGCTLEIKQKNGKYCCCLYVESDVGRIASEFTSFFDICTESGLVLTEQILSIDIGRNYIWFPDLTVEKAEIPLFVAV